MPGCQRDKTQVVPPIALDFAAAAVLTAKVPRDFFGMVVYESRVGIKAGNKRQRGVIFEQRENGQAGHQTR
jgi:hypothetical protein